MNSSPPQIPVMPAPLGRGLPHLSASLDDDPVVKIVALGSSTTAGEGNIVPYPHRLEMMLRENYKGRTIDVLNRGIGGEEAPKERDRLQQDVLDEHPCLVIWQMGTNAVYQGAADRPPSLGETIAALRDGIDKIRTVGKIDVILMDLQYLPAVLTPATRRAAEEMVQAIAATAEEMQVNLFQRFKLMQDWYDLAGITFDQMVNPNDPYRLHQSEWATQNVSEELRKLIVAELQKLAPTR